MTAIAAALSHEDDLTVSRMLLDAQKAEIAELQAQLRATRDALDAFADADDVRQLADFDEAMPHIVTSEDLLTFRLERKFVREFTNHRDAMQLLKRLRQIRGSIS